MTNDSKQNQVIAIAARTLQHEKDAAANLIRNHGIPLSKNPTQKEIDAGFAALLPRSPKFRKDFAQLSAQAYHKNSLNFSGDDAEFFNASGGGASNPLDPSNLTAGKEVSDKLVADEAGKQAARDAARKEKSDYWKSVFSPELIQTALTTGLNVWAAKKMGGTSGVTDTTNEIDNARNNPNDNTRKSGISPTILVIAGLLAVSGAVYLVVRALKNKKGG